MTDLVPWSTGNDRSLTSISRETFRVDRLQAENDVLREKLKALQEDFLGDDMIFPVEWRLTASEKRVLAVLIARIQVTKQQLLTALTRYEGEEPEIKIIDVFICRIRSKLAAFGIVIETIWGVGYFIGQRQRLELRARLTAGQAIDLPKEVTPAIGEVLGLPMEHIRPVCALYRAAGFEIAGTIEAEQSFILFRFLPLAIQFGDGWKAKAHADVRAHYEAVATDAGTARRIAGPAS